MKVVIVEDEKNARAYLTKLLANVEPTAEVVKELESIKSAVNYFQGGDSYDIILMDIQIADGLSFEIFSHVTITKPIIFTTAYDEYAIDAFKLHSIDYLLKPIIEKDLVSALDKYKTYWSEKSSSNGTEIRTILSQLQKKQKKHRCLVKKGGHFEYINVSDIAFINSSESITFLYTFDGNRFMYAKTVEQLYADLDHDHFYQINRSQVIQSKAIAEIHLFFNQRLKLVLNIQVQNDIDFIVSRKRMASFKEWIDK